MKKAKIVVSALFALIAATMVNTSVSAESTILEKSDRSEYDFHCVVTTYYKDDNEELQPLYQDFYYKFDDNYRGTCYQYLRTYAYAFLTTTPDVDTEALYTILGEEAENAPYYDIADDQIVYDYSEDIDYESLYDIAGVEKVELARYLFQSPCFKHTYESDFLKENGISTDDLLMSIVEAEPGVTLTVDTFADTGYNVRAVEEHEYPGEENGTWAVYFDFDGMDSYMNFDIEAEKIEGVISSSVAISHQDVGSTDFEFDLVAKAQEEPTDAPTEAPTDAPAEAPTSAPTNAPTEAPTSASTNAPTDAPTNPTTGTSTVNNPQTGDAGAYGFVAGLAALMAAAGAAIVVKTKKDDE